MQAETPGKPVGPEEEGDVRRGCMSTLFKVGPDSANRAPASPQEETGRVGAKGEEDEGASPAQGVPGCGWRAEGPQQRGGGLHVKEGQVGDPVSRKSPEPLGEEGRASPPGRNPTVLRGPEAKGATVEVRGDQS